MESEELFDDDELFGGDSFGSTKDYFDYNRDSKSAIYVDEKEKDKVKFWRLHLIFYPASEEFFGFSGEKIINGWVATWYGLIE